jgi:hypothetical protein
VCVCLCILERVFVFMNVWKCVYMFICMYVLCVYMYVYMYVCVYYVYMYVCMCVYVSMYVCVCVYVHSAVQKFPD